VPFDLLQFLSTKLRDSAKQLKRGDELLRRRRSPRNSPGGSENASDRTNGSGGAGDGVIDMEGD